ncbi:MAG: hypothetical protein J3R72DRAFT_130533 [Linnemannia gamsii]|nr:MAG: hypothetical protein J3R72DRAFT_130533 [Linnemannia gamsii]
MFPSLPFVSLSLASLSVSLFLFFKCSMQTIVALPWFFFYNSLLSFSFSTRMISTLSSPFLIPLLPLGLFALYNDSKRLRERHTQKTPSSLLAFPSSLVFHIPFQLPPSVSLCPCSFSLSFSLFFFSLSLSLSLFLSLSLSLSPAPILIVLFYFRHSTSSPFFYFFSPQIHTYNYTFYSYYQPTIHPLPFQVLGS